MNLMICGKVSFWALAFRRSTDRTRLIVTTSWIQRGLTCPLKVLWYPTQKFMKWVKHSLWFSGNFSCHSTYVCGKMVFSHVVSKISISYFFFFPDGFSEDTGRGYTKAWVSLFFPVPILYTNDPLKSQSTWLLFMKDCIPFPSFLLSSLPFWPSYGSSWARSRIGAVALAYATVMATPDPKPTEQSQGSNLHPYRDNIWSCWAVTGTSGLYFFRFMNI